MTRGFAFIAVALTLHLAASEPAKTKFSKAEANPAARGVLWRDPGDIGSLNLFYGPGGKEHEPAGTFRFLEEDKQGSSPKFDVEDDQGVRWRVKLGEESQPEIPATRLLWAMGYFADEDYYMPDLSVAGMPKLSRGDPNPADSVIHGARLKRKPKGQKKIGNWSWFENPFTGTKEFNGLRIMMALLNNWDLKEINNAIYEQEGSERRYAVSDVGSTFGRTGNFATRSKSNAEDYLGTRFIRHVTTTQVDFFLSSRPLFLAAPDISNYVKRTKMETIVKHIPRGDAKWLGQLLGRLSTQQIRDSFRAAGYSPEEVGVFATMVQGRIAALLEL